MIEIKYAIVIGLGSFLIGLLVGMIRVYLYHRKKTGKWIFEEATKQIKVRNKATGEEK